MLGAVNMEFSLAAVNSEMRKNAFVEAGVKMLLGAASLAASY